MYPLTTPFWLRMIAPPNLIWDKKKKTKTSVYLTFDDGPQPYVTDFVLQQLKKHEAKGTFFCVGQNVEKHPEIYASIKAEGHTTANHGHRHLHGLKTSTKIYTTDVLEAKKIIDNPIFRPPYGKINWSQARLLQQKGFQIIMWSLLSGDFDPHISPESCYQNVVKNIQPGDIVVFHDSEKAWERLQHTLPKVLDFCTQQGWRMEAL